MMTFVSKGEKTNSSIAEKKNNVRGREKKIISKELIKIKEKDTSSNVDLGLIQPWYWESKFSAPLISMQYFFVLKTAKN